VYKRVGEPVHKGDVLGLIDASEVGRAKAEYLLALRSLELKVETQDRLRQAAATAALPERQLREGETAVGEARIRLFTAQQALVNLGLPIRAEQSTGLSDEQLARRLQFLGLPERIVSTLDPASTTANLMPLVAPFDGVVIRSEVAVGEVVSNSQPQFIIADVRRLWVTLDVRQEDVGPVRKGQRVEFRPDGFPNLEATGEVAWVSTEVNDRTRTVSIRAEVDNRQGLLRAHSFGTGKILVAEKADAITIPVDALQWSTNDVHSGSQPERSPLIFVCKEDKLSFEPRKIEIGLRSGSLIEIVAGIQPGEMVATTGSHMLRSELFKHEIGGGD
jgi:cobalt-zinc-cadmium efflux system membrane fusion protein